MVAEPFSLRYTHDAAVDEDLAMLRNGTASYYQQDGLGTITSLSNSSGVLAETYTYDSYGKTTASTGTLVNPFQYTGREFDSETGIYYYRAPILIRARDGANERDLTGESFYMASPASVSPDGISHKQKEIIFTLVRDKSPDDYPANLSGSQDR
jgi:hypothetical protein